jgi:hypothetical protein
MFAEEYWLPLIRELDARLEPIAKHTVDISDPLWIFKVRSLPPFDQAGVRPAAEELLQKLIREYEVGDDGARAAIRTLFRRFSSFAWAAMRSVPLSVPKTTTAGFRARLLQFSIVDQGLDQRHATLWLDDLVETARRAGVDVNPVLQEVASLSSQQDRYSWGSTSDWLLRRAAG